MAVNYRMGRRGAPLTRLNGPARGLGKLVGAPTPPVPPIILTFDVDGVLTPENVQDAPEWFAFEDFTLTIGGDTANVLWVDDHWETDFDFTEVSGTGTVAQGSNTNPALWYATLASNYILAALSVRISGAAGTLITWSNS